MPSECGENQKALKILVDNENEELSTFIDFYKMIAKPFSKYTVIFLDKLMPMERHVAINAILMVPRKTTKSIRNLNTIQYIQIINSIRSSKAWEEYCEEEVDS